MCIVKLRPALPLGRVGRYVSNSLKKTFEDMDMQNAFGAEAFLFSQYFFDFCFKFSTPDLWTFMELYGQDSLKPLQSEC